MPIIEKIFALNNDVASMNVEDLHQLIITQFFTLTSEEGQRMLNDIGSKFTIDYSSTHPLTTQFNERLSSNQMKIRCLASGGFNVRDNEIVDKLKISVQHIPTISKFIEINNSFNPHTTYAMFAADLVKAFQGLDNTTLSKPSVNPYAANCASMTHGSSIINDDNFSENSNNSLSKVANGITKKKSITVKNKTKSCEIHGMNNTHTTAHCTIIKYTDNILKQVKNGKVSYDQMREALNSAK